MSKSFKACLAAFALAAAAPQATAACDGCVKGAVIDAKVAITQKLAEVSQNIIEAMKNLAQSSTATITQQQASSAEMIAQANQRTLSAAEQQRQDARFAHPDECGVLAPTRGVQDAGRQTIALGGGIGRGSGGGGGAVKGGESSNMRKALDIAANKVEAPPPEQQAALAASGACTSFGNDKNPVRTKSCTLAGFGSGTSTGYPDADIRAETLFDGPQTAKEASGFKRRLTVGADGNERVAVEAYTRNLNTPIDLPQLSKSELARPAGRQYMAARDAYEARMALAMKPAHDLVQNRTQNAATKDVVTQMLASDVHGAYTQNYLTRYAPPNWQARGISVDELINLEAEKRYLNAKWHVAMAKAAPEMHTREQTTMMAFQVMLLARLYEKMEQMGVVNGQMAASAVRQEMVPQLITLHSQAVR